MGRAPEERFADFMARTGRTVTEHRARVVDTALAHTGTFSHEDVLAALQGKVSVSTVYRSLAWMVEAGVLRQIELNDLEVFVVIADEQ